MLCQEMYGCKKKTKGLIGISYGRTYSRPAAEETETQEAAEQTTHRKAQYSQG